MALRARPDGSAAAARVAALMPVTGGWLPPTEGGRAAAEVPAAAVAQDPAWPDAQDPAGPDAPARVAPTSAAPAVAARGPAATDAPAPAGQAPAAAVAAQVPDAVPRATDERPEGPAAPGSRSWAAGRPGAHLAHTARFRLDPGRRGAIALVLAAALAAVVAGGVALSRRPQEVPVPVVEAAGVPLPGASSAPPPGTEVVVAVGGKVRRPGLIRLPAGSRVDDAVRAAGGPVPGADVGVLNLARRLVDGEQVLVGVAPPPGAPAAAGGAGGLLDLNTASASDLDALPGIGPVLAQRIVDWRTENGRFASVDQLREVTGIGEAKYEDLRAKVTV